MSENRGGPPHTIGQVGSSHPSYEVFALDCLNYSFVSFGFISPLLMWKNGKGANNIQIGLWNTGPHPFRKLSPQSYYVQLQNDLCPMSPVNSVWTGWLGIRGPGQFPANSV